MHEAALLLLDSRRAREELHWSPRVPFQDAVVFIVRWYRLFYDGASIETLREELLDQIRRYGTELSGA